MADPRPHPFDAIVDRVLATKEKIQAAGVTADAAMHEAVELARIFANESKKEK